MNNKIMDVLSNKWLVLAIRLILGITFIWASIEKIANPGGFLVAASQRAGSCSSSGAWPVTWKMTRRATSTA